MAWWHERSAAPILVVVDSQDAGTAAHPGFREMTRRVEAGRFDRLEYLGTTWRVALSRGDGFTPAAPVASWRNHIPPDLVRRWATSVELRMWQAASVDVAGGRVGLLVPSALTSGLLLRPAALRQTLELSDERSPLFPGLRLAEAIPARAALSAALDSLDLGAARRHT